MVLLAVATNLPEIAITSAAALAHDLGIAIGNILGGIAIQTVVLVALDAAMGPRSALTMRAASLVLALEGLLVIAVLAISVMGAQPVAGCPGTTPRETRPVPRRSRSGIPRRRSPGA